MSAAIAPRKGKAASALIAKPRLAVIATPGPDAVRASPVYADEIKVREALEKLNDQNARRTDRCIAALLLAECVLLEWILATAALSSIQLHSRSAAAGLLWLVAAGGAAITLVPAWMALAKPGSRLTRHAMAAAQMLMSLLLIHVTGNRIETHFFIFGSLAFLAFYLDWSVLITASAIVSSDHLLCSLLSASLGGFGPIGRMAPVQPNGWLLFCDSFLVASCLTRMRHSRFVAEQATQFQTQLSEAYTDALTGMPNRLHLQKELEARLATAGGAEPGFELLYIDLDGFDAINQRCGREVGDRVLVEVAARLVQEQPEKAFFARLHGDKFIALCPRGRPGVDDGDCARQVLTSLLLPINVCGELLSVGASMGVALHPKHGTDAEDLLRRAEQAMLRVKRKGRRGFAIYHPSLESIPARDASAEREQATRRLRRAIEQDQFSMHYQPVVSTEGELEGLEALLRWFPPGEAPVSPGEFIPLAEETGLIVELGQLILEKVCRQAAAWHSGGVSFGHIAINLSPRQLLEADFLGMLDHMMKRFAIHPDWIAFEITESACASDDGPLAECLQALQTRGIRVMLDDFGTGYSSFGRLQAMSFNTLKIDQIFISRLGQSETGSGVVAGIINIAHLMGMTVVAEGVENEAQRALLKELHCDLLQGYHLSRPLAPEAAREFILRTSMPPGKPSAADARLPLGVTLRDAASEVWRTSRAGLPAAPVETT